MLVTQLAGEVLAADVIARLHEAGHPAVRYAHGFYLQVVAAGPRPVGEIAEALGVTSQAVSKAVRELEGLGYLERRPAPEDARRRLVALTPRGEALMRDGRRARAAIGRELRRAVGAERAAEAAAVLVEVLAARGALEAVRGRRVRSAR